MLMPYGHFNNFSRKIDIRSKGREEKLSWHLKCDGSSKLISYSERIIAFPKNLFFAMRMKKNFKQRINLHIDAVGESILLVTEVHNHAYVIG